MTTIKVSSKVAADAWHELKALADASHQSIAGLLTEAIRDYLMRRRIRPETVAAMDASLDKNAELGRLLAR